jgi:Reverse transcriptase (RNA-dependent DNA polymerase)
VNHLKDNKILSEHQFGFQEKTSTLHHLTKLTNFITKELNEKNYVVGIFLDLKKAFDVVPHNILLKKLEKMGIVGLSLSWFTSYLEGRSQCVEISNNMSSLREIIISVLQGSILGPILFLCFINDLPICNELLSLLFADDTAAVTAGPDLKNVIQKANSELKKIANWFRSNKMAVNVSKTKFIVFKPKGMQANLDDDNWIYYDDNEIGKPIDPSKVTKLDRICLSNANPNDRYYKLLGVYLDEHLSFDQHCSVICNKISRSNYIINRAKNLLPLNALKSLYFALVHPHLLYCLPIIACTSQSNISKLFKAQKKAIRTITRSPYNAHTQPLFQDLKIMPLNILISYTQSLLMHSIVHKYGPEALHNTWTTNLERNPNLLLRNANDLYVPRARTEHTKKLPYFALSKLWNDLPDLKLTPNPITFKILIKEHFSNAI